MRSYVYFVTDGTGSIKIGKANDILSRIPELQTGNPHCLELVRHIECRDESSSQRLEQILHARFEYLRIKTHDSEWFLYDKSVFEKYFSELDKNSNSLPCFTKRKRSPLVINNLYGEQTECFGATNSPACYFYINSSAHILDNFENSLKMKIPYRTMPWPTKGKSLLLPYSDEKDRVFISAKKHEENLIQNRFNKMQKGSSLESFFG